MPTRTPAPHTLLHAHTAAENELDRLTRPPLTTRPIAALDVILRNWVDPSPTQTFCDTIGISRTTLSNWRAGATIRPALLWRAAVAFTAPTFPTPEQVGTTTGGPEADRLFDLFYAPTPSSAFTFLAKLRPGQYRWAA